MKTLKAGTTKDFFAGVCETAREIDENKAVTQKDIIWIEADTMLIRNWKEALNRFIIAFEERLTDFI